MWIRHIFFPGFLEVRLIHECVLYVQIYGKYFVNTNMKFAVYDRVFTTFADSIMAFAWEPIGHRFAFIHGESPRINVSFYHIKKQGSVEILSNYCSIEL